MVERHEIAKAKESITYGLQSSKYPPCMTSQLHCKLRLVTSKDQDKFDIFWSDATNNTIRSIAIKASDYLSNEIKQKENKMQSCRHIALKALGVATKGSASTKKNIDDKIQELNAKFSKELDEHPSKIRNATSANRGHRYHQPQNRGRPFTKFQRGRGRYGGP